MKPEMGLNQLGFASESMRAFSRYTCLELRILSKISGGSSRFLCLLCYLITFFYFRIISDLQKSCKDSPDDSHVDFTQFFPLLTSYISMMHWNTFLKLQTLFRFHQFLYHSFFCSRIPSRIPHCIQLSCLPSLFRVCDSFSVFPCLL